MMNDTARIEALTEMAAKVEAGAATPADFCAVWPGSQYVGGPGLAGHNAYHGSLDAAKALHEAVLPGWWYKAMNGCGPAFVQVGMPGIEVISGTHDTSPARAWLLAIIRAMIAQHDPA